MCWQGCRATKLLSLAVGMQNGTVSLENISAVFKITLSICLSFNPVIRAQE